MSEQTHPPRLTVVTAVSRARNLSLMTDGVAGLGAYFRVRWAVVYSPAVWAITGLSLGRDWVVEARVPVADPGGYAQKNGGIDMALRPGWVMFLDDDNLIHPDAARVLSEAVAAHPDALGMTFHQVRPNGERFMTAAPERTRVGTVDQGNFIAHTSLIGHSRHREVGRGFDGVFIEELYAKAAGRWVFVDAVAAYYNALA